MKLSEIAVFLKGELVSDADLDITGLAKIESAQKGELTFLANPKYSKFLDTTYASAVLVSKEQKTISIPYIKVDDPYLAFLEMLKFFNPPVEPNFNGVHQSAVIAESASIGKNAQIGPFTFIGENVTIGADTIIYPGCVVLDNVKIGENCKIHSNVSIREECSLGNNNIIHSGVVIGSDGFGFAPTGDTYKKIPQLGKVVIENDVEIGANSTIDRATLGDTIIKDGCKIDNLVQIAHNVVIDENTVIVAQTGISGSTKLGKHVTVAGQVGMVGHIEIGDNAIIAAQSGISKNVPAGEVWFGSPAQPIMKQKKVEASLRHLPELAKKIHQMEKTIYVLEEKIKKKSKKDGS